MEGGFRRGRDGRTQLNVIDAVADIGFECHSPDYVDIRDIDLEVRYQSCLLNSPHGSRW